MLNKKLSTLIIAIFIVSTFLTTVQAQSGNETYTVIPTPTPSPTPTLTPTPTPSPTNTTTNQTTTYTDENATYTDNLNSTYKLQNINPKGAPLQFSTYNPTVASLICTGWVNCSVNVYGSGHWSDNRDSSGQICFYPSEIGTYQVEFSVAYDRLVNQTITLTILNGDNTQDVLYLDSCNYGFTLDILLEIQALPHFPTAEEIAKANEDKNRALISDINTQNLADKQTTWLLIGAIVVVLVVAVVILTLYVRRQNHMHKRLLRAESQGYNWRLQ